MSPESTRAVGGHLSPGLYKLTVDADARGFDWESLYFGLDLYGNAGRRTGPWDFDLRCGNPPLLPAYWVYQNGRKIGLWYLNRPSFRQVQAKRLKGEACFRIEREGDYGLRFEPYREFSLEWADARLEPSPDDALLDELRLRPEAERGLQRLFDGARWARLAEALDDPEFPCRALLEEGLDWGLRHDRFQALPLLAARYRLRRDAASLERARAHIEELLALPAWGHPEEDRYGHNGDMGCAFAIRDLGFALNLLHEELGAESVQAILARLERQGDTFLELALLHHGYWGGSILQDHGFVSITTFAGAAYSLLGWLPRAEEWLRFCLPRVERTLRALPTDGVIPTTSYHLVSLYTDKLVLFRELHRQATGEDIYARPALRSLADYCVESSVEETGQLLHPSARGDLTPLSGGHALFDAMARTFRDADAAWLSRECQRFLARQPAGERDASTYLATLCAALLYEPVALERQARPPRRLRWFRDSGTVVYRDDARGILLSTRCGAPNSTTSYGNVTCACDRSHFAQMSGNFAITRHGLPLIQTAEGGYSMRTELGNVLLVDGQGQYSDAGFPMSYPDAYYGGEAIEEASLDPLTGTGSVRLQLGPAYDPALGIQRYTREWFFEPDGRMRLVDTIASSRPHRYTWLFQTYRSHPITGGDREFTIRNGEAALDLRVVAATAPLSHAVGDTLTVWAYRNDQGNQACHHLAFETREAVREVSVEFVLC